MPQMRSQLSVFMQRRLQIERRAFKRVTPVHHTLCLLQAPDEKDWAIAVIQNLSLKGAGVLVEREYAPGTVLRALLVNATHTFSVALELKVARCFRDCGKKYIVAGPFTTPLSHDEIVPLVI